MIADFVISVLGLIFFTGASLMAGLLGGAAVWAIPAFIHDVFLDESTEGKAGIFFGIFVVAAPLIFGLMTAFTVATFFYDTEQSRAANKPLPISVIAEEVHRIRLIELDPPKHVYADFVNLTTEQTEKRVYVSKHCNNHRQNSEGDEYNVKVTRKKQGDKEFVEYNDLYMVFCGGN